MTSFDFAYYKPDTLSEAMECYQHLATVNKSALYYGGGTEIISMARAESIRFNAVIDLKGIPECNALSMAGGDLVIGGAVTLTAISESGYFPLLCETVSRIADHTIQGKITLGGNLGGTIMYREAALPLMITYCRAKVMTKNGLTEVPFSRIFDGQLRLEPGEFLAQIWIGQDDINLPYNHVKRTKMDKIDYPLITLTANKKHEKIRAAVSGAGNMPTLLSSDALNNHSVPEDERIAGIITQIDSLIIGDIHASREYRKFVLRNVLSQMYRNFMGG